VKGQTAASHQGGHEEVRMMRARGIVLLGLLAALSACGFDLMKFGGHSYSERHGVLEVDGVQLPNKRWVAVDVPVATGSLDLSSATQDIVLSGSPDGASHLEVQLFSELEGDGSVHVDGGKLVTSASSGRLVIVNGMRGTLAKGMKLTLENGTGALHLEGLPELRDVRLDNGTGEVRLVQCGAGDVLIDCGTGDVHLESLKAARLEITTGTGAVRLATTSATQVKLSTGTGDIAFSDCNSSRTDVESGTGNVRLEGENVLGSVNYDLGTGKVQSR
jgi:hypothetical protein